MDLSNAEVAEAFSRHEFAKAYDRLDPDVRWDVVGDKVFEGSAAVRAQCAESARWLASATTTFRRFDLLVGPDFVVADTTAEYAADDGDPTVVGSCDVYRFRGDRLVAIRSYTVEVTTPSPA